MNEAPSNWPVDFLERAVTVYDCPADPCLVWLVDFEYKIATTGDPSTCANQEWETFDKPSAEKFIEFLNAQRPQSEEVKTSQEYVRMLAEYQKQQQNEQRLIAVGTPILVGFLQAQATLYSAALPSIIQETNNASAIKQLEELLDLATHEEMVDEALKLAKLFLDKVKS